MFPDELEKTPTFNFAPMIDFLFLMLALFATLAMSRSALVDTQIDLAKLKSEKNRPAKNLHAIHLSIGPSGQYKWLTEFQEYPMPSPTAVQEELTRQYNQGSIPQDRLQTEVLFHIDKHAPWEKVAQLLFAVREVGFTARPVYEGT
jgi:biopolymer transport protein ExbD